MVQEDAKDASAEGRRLVRALLDVDPLTVDALLTVAHDVLGPERAEHCVTLVRAGRLTRRSHLLAEVAAVVVGTRHLGVGWWARPHRRADRPGEWQEGPPPDEVLVRGVAPRRWRSASVLEVLAWWSADDVADALWGPPIDFVDLNSTRSTDRIALPVMPDPAIVWLPSLTPAAASTRTWSGALTERSAPSLTSTPAATRRQLRCPGDGRSLQAMGHTVYPTRALAARPIPTPSRSIWPPLRRFAAGRFSMAPIQHRLARPGRPPVT